MVCRVITCFIEFEIGWADDSGIELEDIDFRYITLGKLLEDIGDKKGISLIIADEIPAQIPDKLSRCVKRLRLEKGSIADQHCISTW